jgi:tRNA(Ser,Leu) C12 N-acetylase TAN1
MVVAPGDSIQAAVDSVQPGDTIVVEGRYRENVAITTDGITLRGLGAVLESAATLAQNACVDPSAPTGVSGICILGEFAGLGVLPGPAGLFHLTGNRIRSNTKACVAGEDIPFPLSRWLRAGDLSGVWRWF